jgi:hypothetical protein
VRRLRTQCAEDGWLGVVLGTWTRHMDCDEMLLPLDAGPSMGDRCHPVLIVATNSANGGLQSTPAIRLRNRHGRVWVDSGNSHGPFKVNRHRVRH